MKTLFAFLALSVTLNLSAQDYQLNGNLGLGTSPENKLDVAGDSKMDGKLTVTEEAKIEGDTEIEGDLKLSNMANAENEEYYLKVNADGTFTRVSRADFTEAMYREGCKDVNGNDVSFWVADPGKTHIGATCATFVGINTSNPEYSLDVDGSSRIQNRLILGQEGFNLYQGQSGYSLSMNAGSASNDKGLHILHNSSNHLAQSISLENDLGEYFSLYASGSIFSKVSGENWLAYQIENYSSGEKIFQITSDGHVRCTKLIVQNSSEFPDYVFDTDYKLMSLFELEQYINEKKHLPNMPSSTEVAENGADLGEINRVLVEKVEELTLYTIAQQKELEELKKLVNALLEKEKATETLSK